MPRKDQPLNLGQAFLQMGETLGRQVTTPNIFGYIPHEKQLIFHTSNKRRRLYIGGNRSGKTTGGVVEDIMLATGRHPYRNVPQPWDIGGIRGRVCTTDFPNGLAQIILPQFARWLPKSDLINGSWEDSYDKQLKELTLTCGSTIEFKSYDQDLDKFAGTSRHWIHCDEEPPQAIESENAARLIDTGGIMYYTMTPVEGMSWLYETYYVPGIAGDPYIDVIEVDMTENPHLLQSEIDYYVSTLDEEEVEARKHGKFVQMGGLIYKQFDPTIGGLHVIEAGWKPPRDWIVIVSLDAGYNNPTAVLWHAVSPDGSIITFAEHYVSGQTTEWHALEILKRNKALGVTPQYYVADPSIRNTQQNTGTSLHEEYLRFGIPFVLGNNDVKSGLVRVARYLKPYGIKQIPRWRVTANCVKTIWEMSRYHWKTYASKKVQMQHNAQDEPAKINDHACDSLRYFIMMQPDFASEFQERNENDHTLPEFSDEFSVARRVDPETGWVIEEVADPWNRHMLKPAQSDYAQGDGNSESEDMLGGMY